MPIYEYECQSCSYNFEIEQKVKDKPKKKCPHCKKMKLERLISRTLGFVHGDINTIGQLAETNSKKMGKYKLSEIQAKKDEKEGPVKKRKELHKKINKMTPLQKRKFIYEGKT